MASASDIGANFSNYSGDPNLGGGSFGAVRINTGPLEDLARYTFLYHKSEYDQRQKDREKAAAELADYMMLDYTTTIPEDFKYLQGKFEEFKNYSLSHLDAVTYKDPKAWAELQAKRGELLTDIKYGKMNSLANLNRLKEIADEPTEEGKKILKKDLQKDIESRKDGIRTILNSEQKRDLTFTMPGTNQGVKVDVTKQGSNEIFQRDFILFDVPEAKRAGAEFDLGISAIDMATTSGQLKDARLKENGWVKAADFLNKAIQGPEARTEGVIDESKLSGLKILNNIKQYNDYLARTKAEIKAGVYLDKLGNKLSFGTGLLDEANYEPINWKDGLSAGELGQVMQFSQWAGDSYGTKIIQTNTQIEKGRLAAEWSRIGIAREQFDLEEKKFKTSSAGTEQDKSAALAFANNLFLDIASKASIKGVGGAVVLTPNDVRQLGQDQLKYLGIEAPVKRDEDGKVIESGGLQPLKLEEGDLIQLETDGTIKIMKNAKYDAKIDRWTGQWDNEKSTSVWNAARNLLNEENVKSGTKERNAYLPIDLKGKFGVIQVDQSGGKQTTQEQKKTIKKVTVKGL